MSGFQFRLPGSRRQGGSEQLGCVGRLFLTAFFAAFAGFGGFFIFMMVKSALETVETYKWEETNCTIVSSEVEQRSSSENPYVFQVEYTYEVDGKEYTSNVYSTEERRSSEYSKIDRLIQRYPPGTKTTCYVDPTNPQNAILERASLWFLLFVFIPLIFIVVGVGGIYFMVAGARKKAGMEALSESVTEKAAKPSGPAFFYILFGAFLVIGGILSYFLLVRPISKVLDARDWVETPCTILSSRVTSHSDSDGTTYGVDIFFSYEYDGVEHKSNKYDFMGGSSSGYKGKKAIVDRYPKDSERVCYVNPDNPGEAVLQRGFSPTMLFGLIPVVFFVVGLGGLTYQIRHRGERTASSGAAAAPRPTWMPETPAAAPAGAGVSVPTAPTGAGGPVTLKPRTPAVIKLIGMIIFAVFWNGIISVFIAQVVQGWQSGNPDWFMTLFMTPFVVVGIGAIGGIFYFAMALTNPKPTLRVSSASVPLGGSLNIEWQLTGKTRAVERLRIYLEGREEARYRRGTKTYTDKETFATIEIAETRQFREMLHGSTFVNIPADTMHSFEASNNKIIWSLCVHGDIPRWPDIKQEFPIVVEPMQHAQG